MTYRTILQSSFRHISAAAVVVAAAGLFGCSTAQSQPSVAASADCHGVAANDQVLEKFYQPGTVQRATPVKERMFKARASQPVRTMGASLYFPAEPEMNGPYLRRVLACHAAHGESIHPNDPLHPKTGTVANLVVRENGNGYSVDVLADNPRVGEEIWQRAEAFHHDKGSVQIEQVSSVKSTTTM